jgi:DNA-binding winged helix-turn-helix (wHTH) protein/Flp pilus assembly protein TadD
MNASTNGDRRLHFGLFEADLATAKLYKRGLLVHLENQPFQILTILVDRAGQVVSREELRTRLWPSDTFVEFDESLNTAIGKLRYALGDSADNPRFVETLPRRGYRFIAPVRNVATSAVQRSPTPSPSQEVSTEISRSKLRARTSLVVIAAACASAMVVLLVAGALSRRSRQEQRLTEKDTLVLADFDNRTGEAIFDDTLKQALAVDLEQSPFLDVLSDRRVAQTLQLMGRSPGDRLTAALAQELCTRAGSKAILSGSIANLGGEYVIALNATDCATGDSLAMEQMRAPSKANVLKALDRSVASVRTKLGELLSSVQEFATPVEEATTPSLQALQAYSLGLKTFNTNGPTAALPFYQQAIERDPKFAMAHARIATAYADLGMFLLAAEHARTAYRLRDAASERERLYLDSVYYNLATGELEKAAQQYELWQHLYPHDATPHVDLGTTDSLLGKYEEAGRQYEEAQRLEPSIPFNYLNLAENYVRTGRLQEAQAVCRQAEQRKLDESVLINRYQLAFLKGDVGEMARLQGIGSRGAETQGVLLAMQGETEAWHGRLAKARQLTQRAIELAQQNNSKEMMGALQAYAGLREVELGYSWRAGALARAALTAAPNRVVEPVAGLALARAGDAQRALKLMEKLARDFPRDTMIKSYWVPAVRAASYLRRGDAANAIELLQATSPYELGADASMYPIYLRGEAYIEVRNGPAAVAEFQKILDHPGIVLNFPLGALARLGLGRSYALSGDTAKSRATYEDFLALWKDADPNIPVLREAKTEYAKLNQR